MLSMTLARPVYTVATSHLHTPLRQSMLREALSCMHNTVDGHQAAGQLSVGLLALLLESPHVPNSAFAVKKTRKKGDSALSSPAQKQLQSGEYAHVSREPP